MPSDRWQRLDELFAAVADLAPDERLAYLEEACQNDPDLRAEVLELVACDKPSTDTLVGAVTDAAAGPRPERIGAYRVTGELGQGGMGTVYAGERDDDQFRQRVAIKLLLGPVTPETQRRFLSERQILANLEHTNIARLIDGGATPEGSPYVVMERIDGRPIDAFCDQNLLGLRARIELFRQVCDAVQYAHRNLVVHRDLKPGNILVTEEGDPKLLDFGIAKLLDPDGGDGTIAVTAPAQRLLTPDFASPEQVRGESITTQSDLYSLGVLLYTLLAGVKPYRVTTGELTEMERVVCLTTPPLPSAAAPDRQLRRRLAGDLDNIVTKAMRKEPERRYGSCQQLSEDLQRYLEGRPVLARGDTWSYRASKFVRRHRWGVAAAALFLAALIGFGITMSAQATRIAAERDLAEVVVGLMVEVFDASDPENSRGRSTPTREILDRSEERLRTALRDHPETRGRLLDVMGRVYQNLGHQDRAEPLLREALAARVEAHGEESLEAAESLRRIAWVHFGRGQLEQAEALYRQVLAIRRDKLGEEHLDTLESLANVAMVLQERDDWKGAEPLALQVLETRRRIQGEAHESTVVAASNYAVMLFEQDRFKEAVEVLAPVLEQGIAAVGKDHPSIVGASLSHAQNLAFAGKHEEAERLLEEFTPIAETVWGKDDRRVGDGYQTLGQVRMRRKNLAGAEQATRRAIKIHSAHPPQGNIQLARSTDLMANIKMSGGHKQEAIQLLEQCVAQWRAALPEGSAQIGVGLNNAAYTFYDLGQLDRAVELFEETVRIRRAKLEPDHLLTLVSRENLAYAYLDLGRHAEAAGEFRAVWEARKATLGPSHSRTFNSQGRLALSLIELKKYEEAEAILLDKWRLLQAQETPDAGWVKLTRKRLVQLYEAWGKPEAAAPYRE